MTTCFVQLTTTDYLKTCFVPRIDQNKNFKSGIKNKNKTTQQQQQINKLTKKQTNKQTETTTTRATGLPGTRAQLWHAGPGQASLTGFAQRIKGWMKHLARVLEQVAVIPAHAQINHGRLDTTVRLANAVPQRTFRGFPLLCWMGLTTRGSRRSLPQLVDRTGLCDVYRSLNV